MALSGSFQTSKDSHNAGSEWPCYIYVEWSATQSVDNNTSTISWAAYGGSDGTSTTKYTETGPVAVTINGTTVLSLTSRFTMTKGQKIGSGTITIAHNTDGTKSISVGISAAIWQTAVNCTYSGTITLNTIPRATTPTVSSSSVAMNSAVTINTPRASSSFTHTLTYSFGSASGTIATGVGTSYSWTVPLSLANQVPNNTSGSCTITCKTYSGNTLIGTKTVTITLTVPSSVVPSISSVSTSDPTGYLSTYGAYVQGKSTLKVSVSASGSYSSTIKSYKIVANGSTYTANGSTTGTLKSSGSNSISVTVTDSRGRTASKSVSISVLAYSNPSISALVVARCLSDGTADASGAYMKVTVGASITALNSKNSKTIVIDYKKTSDSRWTTYKKYTDRYSLSDSYVIAADVNYSYNVRVTATDSFTSSVKETDLTTAFTLMDFRSTGKGIAFGKVSEEDSLDINMATMFRQGIKGVSDVIAGYGTDNEVSLQTLNSNLATTKNNSYPNIATFTGNLDSASPNGIFITNSSTSGTKPSLGSICIVLAWIGVNYAIQVAFGYYQDKIAIRRKYNSSTWTSWVYIS